MIYGPVIPMTAEQFGEWLKCIAAKGDGRLSTEDLREVLRYQGLHFKWWKIWRAMKHADLDRNRRINGEKEFQELVEYARKRWGFIIENP